MIGTFARALTAAVFVAAPVAASPGPSAPDLRARLEQYVRARAPHSVTAIEIPGLADFELPGISAGSVDVALSARSSQRFVGWVPVTVALRSEGRELKRGVVTVRVTAEERVLVATRSLRTGDTLRGADLAFELRDLAELPRGGVTDPGRLVGRRVKRFVAAGDPMALAWTEPVPRIRRGRPDGPRLDGARAPHPARPEREASPASGTPAHRDHRARTSGRLRRRVDPGGECELAPGASGTRGPRRSGACGVLSESAGD